MGRRHQKISAYDFFQRNDSTLETSSCSKKWEDVIEKYVRTILRWKDSTSETSSSSKNVIEKYIRTKRLDIGDLKLFKKVGRRHQKYVKNFPAKWLDFGDLKLFKNVGRHHQKIRQFFFNWKGKSRKASLIRWEHFFC